MGPLKIGQRIAWGGQPGQGVKKRPRRGRRSALFRAISVIDMLQYQYQITGNYCYHQRREDSMPRGASPKRERQYEKIKQSAKKSGRYGARAEEVAARTVDKIRRKKGEAKAQRSGSKKSPNRMKASATKSRRSSQSPARASRSRRPSANGRGFAGMSDQRQREIAAEGGRAAHEQGTAHEFSPAEARKAGQKGGEAVSRNRSHMAEIGRRGGER